MNNKETIKQLLNNIKRQVKDLETSIQNTSSNLDLEILKMLKYYNDVLEDDKTKQDNGPDNNN